MSRSLSDDAGIKMASIDHNAIVIVLVVSAPASLPGI